MSDDLIQQSPKPIAQIVITLFEGGVIGVLHVGTRGSSRTVRVQVAAVAVAAPLQARAAPATADATKAVFRGAARPPKRQPREGSAVSGRLKLNTFPGGAARSG